MTTTTEPRRVLMEFRPPVPTFESVEDERLYCKRQLAAAYRIFTLLGLDQGRAGHISIRDPEHTDLFWMNPLTVPFSMMKVSDLQLISFDGEIVEGDLPVNHAGFAIHSQILRDNPHINSAAHMHSLYGKAWSSLGRPLDPISQDACLFYGSHHVVNEYHGAVDMAEGKRLADAAGENKLLILQNHGWLTLGHSVDEAAWYFMAAEWAAQAQIIAESVGTPIHVLPEYAAHIGRPRPYQGYSFQAYYDRIILDQPDLLD
jgi:ribulose-5-phosphate 4-epimerase/fuculose-1-phosphate aldolase